MSVSIAQAREYIEEGFEDVFDRDLGTYAMLAVGGVSELETNRTNGWKGAGAGSFNAGAITAGPSWKGATFEYRDSRPDPKNPGKDLWYVTKFRKYATPREGFADLVRIVLKSNRRDQFVLPAAESGDLLGVSRGLYKTVYYTGRAADGNPEARIRRHYEALYRGAKRMADGLGVTMPGAVVVPKPKIEKLPVLHRGSGYKNLVERDHVRVVQRALGIVADGLFGPIMEKSVKKIQTAAHKIDKVIDVDGVVGPQTYKLLGLAA